VQRVAEGRSPIGASVHARVLLRRDARKRPLPLATPNVALSASAPPCTKYRSSRTRETLPPRRFRPCSALMVARLAAARPTRSCCPIPTASCRGCRRASPAAASALRSPTRARPIRCSSTIASSNQARKRRFTTAMNCGSVFTFCTFATSRRRRPGPRAASRQRKSRAHLRRTRPLNLPPQRRLCGWRHRPGHPMV